MKTAKLAVTIALLLFVGATVGTLIAQEIARPTATRTAAESVSSTTSGRTPEIDRAEPAMTEETHLSEVGILNDAESPGEPVCVIDAIYFHNTVRCHTCRTIEETAKAVLEAEFSEEFTTGQMRWSTINMEQERQYVERYDLVKPTLILVRAVGEEQSDWVALDETWSLTRSEMRFADYVENEMRAFLEACP